MGVASFVIYIQAMVADNPRNMTVVAQEQYQEQYREWRGTGVLRLETTVVDLLRMESC